jgi:hypothetical protein
MAITVTILRFQVLTATSMKIAAFWGMAGYEAHLKLGH